MRRMYEDTYMFLFLTLIPIKVLTINKHKAAFVGDYWSFRGFGYSSTDFIYLYPGPTSSYGPLLSALEFFAVQDLGFFESNDRDGKHPHPEKFGTNAF
jgi:hypothetical protein